eukprot:UN03788
MWLNNINLMVYYDLFVEHGFADGTSTVFDLNSDDLQEMGITKVAHRKLILKQIANNKQQILNTENIQNKEMDEGEDTGTNETDENTFGNDDSLDDSSEYSDDLYGEVKVTTDKEVLTTGGNHSKDVTIDEDQDLNKMYGKPLNSSTKQ